MTVYNLCFAWNWEYDTDFAALLHNACGSKGLSLFQVTPDNLDGLMYSLGEQMIHFQVLFDRASDVDERFRPLALWADERGMKCINSYEKASPTWDKAVMHECLINAGLPTPETIILPPYNEEPVIHPMNLETLGEQFNIKPAHGSGGDGVVLEATSFSHVLTVRQEYPKDRYLIQANIIPKELESRPAWFRVIYCAERVYACWWNPQTHVYNPVTAEEESHYGLDPLYDITETIANLTGLDLFSTEIAFTYDDHFVVVDYVNDPIDLRIQSKAPDAVPDGIVVDIAERLASLVGRHCKLPAAEKVVGLTGSPK